MCIRDSSLGVLYYKVPGWPIGFGDKDKARDLLQKALAVNPVSYTHLRAHETVLDLVCRLLLEKKKNHKNTTALLQVL